MRKMNLLLFIVGVILLFGGPANAASSADVPRMAVETLKELLDGSETVPVVLDLRTGSSWKNSEYMIESAIREEPGEMSSWAEKYAKEATLVLYCT